MGFPADEPSVPGGLPSERVVGDSAQHPSATVGPQKVMEPESAVCYHIAASVIMRTIIQLPDEQAEQLAEVSRNQGISRAEAVRRALARYLEEHRQRRREDVFGMWSGRREDGLAYERRLRQEWG